MGRIKEKKLPKLKIQKSDTKKTGCSGNPSFSFEYITANKRYNLTALDNATRVALLERLVELSKSSWLHWHSERREIGIEYIPYAQLVFSPEYITLSKDSKFISIRFNNQGCRIIGQKLDSCSVFCIYGFDVDYSAYNHGS